MVSFSASYPFNKPYFQQSFDYFNQLEKPAVTLCNPDHTQLYSLGACYDTEVKLKWNAQSEFSFRFAKVVNGTTMEAFDYIEGKRVVHIGNIGYFIIHDVEDDFDGSVPIKIVTCLSQESELVYKRVSLFSGTYSLSELMAAMETIATNWNVFYSDSSLDGIYRTFNVSDTNVYQFLTTEVARAFNCIFIFDYNKKYINIISADTTPDNTDVFLSFSNLLEKTEYNEITEEITTCLHCYGGGDLTIADVNPLGGNAIYDFTYYKNTDWMTQGLIDAIDAWEAKIDSYQSEYESVLVDLDTYHQTLLEQEAQLAEYQTSLASLQQVLAAQLQQGIDTTTIEAQIAEMQIIISQQNVLIASTSNYVAYLTASATDITDILDLQNTANFSTTQYQELSNFIFENTYKNDNIIATDSMTFSEIQDQAQQLYDIAVDVLARTAIPRYQVTISSVNFLALAEYLPFINQMTLGDQITIDTERGYFISATLLEYDYSYDDPTVFEIIISNQQRLDNAHFIFSDLIGYSYQQGNTIGFNSSNWNDWTTSKDTVLGNVQTPAGINDYGIKGQNIKGTITANQSLVITNVNSTTGSSNITIGSDGVIIRDASFYSGSNLGIDGNMDFGEGRAAYFRGGLYIGSTGLVPGATLITTENVTSQVSDGVTNFTVSGSYLAGSLWIAINGLDQPPYVTYQEESDVQSFTIYDGVKSGDIVIAKYINLS